MRKVAVNVVVTLMLFTVLAFSFNAIYDITVRKKHQFEKTVLAQKGRSIEAAMKTLGKPFRTMGFGQYKAHLPSYADSLWPDPPLVQCDQVYQYQEVATVGFLFVRNGIVVEIYVGGTWAKNVFARSILAVILSGPGTAISSNKPGPEVFAYQRHSPDPEGQI